MSIKDVLDEIRYAIGPARLVGSRYRLSAHWSGELIAAEGIMTNYLRTDRDRVFYAVSTAAQGSKHVVGLSSSVICGFFK
jgi:hypothetical protein